MMHPLKQLSERVHEANKKWWLNIHKTVCFNCFQGGFDACSAPAEMRQYHPKLERNVGEMLMLIVSEIAEAMEGHRKSLPDDKLPHRPMIEVELADALIRILDVSCGLGLDLAGAFEEKMIYNARREDHTIEARLKEGGKKY